METGILSIVQWYQLGLYSGSHRCQRLAFRLVAGQSPSLYGWKTQTDPLNWDASDCVLCVFRKLSTSPGGVHGLWFHDVWTCSAKVLEYWMISSLRIKLSPTWNFQRNWNVRLVLLERSWWAKFYGIYLVRFGFRMNVGDIDFLSDFRRWKFK
jgi:hypothetical protein